MNNKPEVKGIDGLEYPVEFEMRIIYSKLEAKNIQSELDKILSSHNVALEKSHTLPSTSEKYGRLACKVKFLDKDTLYNTYADIGKIPGIKTVL